MCDFCNKIYENETELDNAHFHAWRNEKTPIDGGFVRTQYGIALMTVDNDNHHDHLLYGVKFCPYCEKRIE